MHSDHQFTITPDELGSMQNQAFTWDIDLPSGVIKDQDMEVLDIQGTVTLQRQLNLIRCQGNLQVSARLFNSRNLGTDQVSFPVAFTEGLEIVEYLHLPDKLELSLEDAVDHIRADEAIDLTELIRQHIILNLPNPSLDPHDAPSICYNESSSEYVSGLDQENDPTWDAIRKTVESWEKPSQN